MIRYTLNCAAGHQFESWFPSSSSYDAQHQRGLVACPTCGSAEVEKAVMAPSVARTDRSPSVMPQPEAEGVPASAPAAPAEAADPPPVSMMTRPEAELRTLMRQLREHIVQNSDYVGDAFPDLARKMHDGEIEHRAIYGEATVDEVKALHEEEVEVFPLPVLPDERN
ncbi:DUF1178 family protein [Xanthobacter sp. V3C-3]|uniref:DUF1178 family protein n=1 Tax=Xanthobacter lutulentifluminis TaxID=3119935 RepID=UPI0037266AFE